MITGGRRHAKTVKCICGLKGCVEATNYGGAHRKVAIREANRKERRAAKNEIRRLNY